MTRVHSRPQGFDGGTETLRSVSPGWHPAAIALGLVLCAGSASAQSQTDLPCQVSILNQSAWVQADWTWFIPNVPSNMGQLRATVTCTQGGVTVTGTTDLFSIEANLLNLAGVVRFTGEDRPQSIDATASASVLLSFADFAQLSVMASYPDGTQKDVTSIAEGTTYATTNPAIAFVDPNGRVTPRASGRVLITALHEAILDVVPITVQLSGDADGDGMPDDWELTHNLDPNEAADAFDDIELDLLTNLEEYQQGTDPRNPDTDADTLKDGVEVHGWPCPTPYTSEPLLWDTDGDGLSDGLEAQRCTDPRTPEGEYTQFLTGLTVSPTDFTLTVNTVVPQRPVRALVVTGTLFDGSTIDLTRGRGTTYQSSDPAVATVDTEGVVRPGPSTGQAAVAVQNSNLTTQAQVTVDTFSPELLAELALNVRDLEIVGTTLHALGDQVLGPGCPGSRHPGGRGPDQRLRKRTGRRKRPGVGPGQHPAQGPGRDEPADAGRDSRLRGHPREGHRGHRRRGLPGGRHQSGRDRPE